MQLSNIIALFAAAVATGVQAAPNAALTERQALISYIRFYGGGGCQEPWIEDTVLQQSDTCQPQTFTGPYGSFAVQSNSFTKTIRIYTAAACGTGNYIDIKPGQLGCFAGKITSFSFL
ncbi:hypothetical protein CC86DRAFT_378500 [Ophiobolus disseminans]|uniref:Uncharacterized protein n=1 Tax=Ophiobolus disseminans TaxID=1469910 RepID=A0A6A7AEM3_9PLEO|nr:hypothetical protein CC86DRAFT_378500 [Ophiobolus disseminans]